jgi:hypothetical protein
MYTSKGNIYNYNNSYNNYLGMTFPPSRKMLDYINYDDYYNEYNYKNGDGSHQTKEARFPILERLLEGDRKFRYNIPNLFNKFPIRGAEDIKYRQEDYDRKDKDYEKYLPWEQIYEQVTAQDDPSKLSEGYKDKHQRGFLGFGRRERFEPFEQFNGSQYTSKPKNMNFYFILVVVIIVILMVVAAIYDMNQPYMCLYK